MTTERDETARAYYRAIDSDAYDELVDLLAPEFFHYRPDQTLDGRERFIEFMRKERPIINTRHAVDAIYASDNEPEVAVRGRLLRDDECLFEFVDVFRFEDDNVIRLRTYTR